MYKKAAGYAQDRTTRTAQFGTHNNEGIDADTWAHAGAGNDEASLRRRKEDLVDQKMRLQGQLTEINTRLGSAKLPEHTHQTLKEQRARIVQDDREISEQLRKLNAALREIGMAQFAAETNARAAKATAKAKAVDFNAIFYELAKELLAGPVFERIRIAAHHRFSEHKDGQ